MQPLHFSEIIQLATWTSTREILILLHTNNKCDKFMQPRILTSPFVVLSFDSRTTIYKLVTIAEQAG